MMHSIIRELFGYAQRNNSIPLWLQLLSISSSLMKGDQLQTVTACRIYQLFTHFCKHTLRHSVCVVDSNTSCHQLTLLMALQDSL